MNNMQKCKICANMAKHGAEFVFKDGSSKIVYFCSSVCVKHYTKRKEDTLANVKQYIEHTINKLGYEVIDQEVKKLKGE